MNIDEMKNKISMELKNPITQQGFEIICKHLTDKDNAIKKLIADMAGLEEELTEKDKQITGLKEENDQLKAQIEKMKCCGNCKYGHCNWSSESIIDGKRQCHAWNKEKEEYCDIGYQGKYQCWELEE